MLPRSRPRSLWKCLHLPSRACPRGSERGRGNQLLEKRNRAPSGETEKGKRERRECMRKAKELRNKSRGFTGSACKVRTPVGEEAGWAYTELCSFYRDFLACGLLRVRWHRHCSPGRPQGAQVLAINAALGLGDSGGSEAWVLLGCD